MALATGPFQRPEQASVADAKLAYFEGDFERCLEICENVRVRKVATASEVALLTARAYLRTGRPREAQSTIVESLETHATLDASLTAQMLLGSARIRQGDPDDGIAILVDAAARSSNAHFAIRSEIAFSTALGHWARREIDAAEEYLTRVDPRSDIIHARALELGAWCSTARRDYKKSAEQFRITLVRLDRCQAKDRAIEATAISTLAILAAELFDRDVARFVEARAKAIAWTSGMGGQRYLTLAHQALFSEFAGNTVDAYMFAAQARESAATVPLEVLGWALSSAIARNAGEAASALFYARRACDLLDGVERGKLSGEERLALLNVAESCAHVDPLKATALFDEYHKLGTVAKVHASFLDPRLTAHEAFIAGVIAQARGECDHAVERYHEAFAIFDRIGYVRRALTTAHAILRLGDDENMRSYIAARLNGTTNYITKSLVDDADDDRIAALKRHRIVASLPPRQREVVILICLGKTNKEIAELRGVGEQTVKNMLTNSIFPAFGVSSRAALVSTCLRAEVALGQRPSANVFSLHPAEQRLGTAPH